MGDEEDKTERDPAPWESEPNEPNKWEEKHNLGELPWQQEGAAEKELDALIEMERKLFRAGFKAALNPHNSKELWDLFRAAYLAEGALGRAISETALDHVHQLHAALAPFLAYTGLSPHDDPTDTIQEWQGRSANYLKEKAREEYHDPLP